MYIIHYPVYLLVVYNMYYDNLTMFKMRVLSAILYSHSSWLKNDSHKVSVPITDSQRGSILQPHRMSTVQKAVPKIFVRSA